LDNIIRSLFFNKDETRLQILYCIFGNLYANCFKKNDDSTIENIFCFLLLNHNFREETSKALINAGREMINNNRYEESIKCFCESYIISGNKEKVKVEIKNAFRIKYEKFEFSSDQESQYIFDEIFEIKSLNELDEDDIDFLEVIDAYDEEVLSTEISNKKFSLENFIDFIFDKNKIDFRNNIYSFIKLSISVNGLKKLTQEYDSLINTIKNECRENKKRLLYERKEGKMSYKTWDSKRNHETYEKKKKIEFTQKNHPELLKNKKLSGTFKTLNYVNSISYFINILYDCHDTCNVLKANNLTHEEKMIGIEKIWSDELNNYCSSLIYSYIGGIIGGTLTGGNPLGVALGSLALTEAISLIEKIENYAKSKLNDLIHFLTK